MNIDVLDSGYTVTSDGKRFGYTTLDDLLNGLRGLLSEQQSGLDLDDDGWREWDGELRSGQKLPPGLRSSDILEVRFRHGNIETGLMAHAWRWKHLKRSDDVVAYRVVRP